MPKNGPVVIVDESLQNQQLICRALDEIRVKNRVELCCSAEEALKFLQTTSEKPFLIITKTDLPAISGLELQSIIFEIEELKAKSIPFIFFSNSDVPDFVAKAYKTGAQGYFSIPKDFLLLKLALFSINDYWQRAVHPSSVYWEMYESSKVNN